ncbi:MAG: MFS transporter [Acidobacteriia bacterium]|nr:MFS transporter [Terriglobia bacterium]
MGDPRSDSLERLSDQEWREALDFSDRSQLTLALRRHMREAMPQWVRERTDGDAAHNLQRLELLRQLYQCLSGRLAAAGIEFAALKGLAHCPDFGSLPEDRPQYDIDLYVPSEEMDRARDVVLALGYEPLESMESSPTDHIPALIRKTGWEWRGDIFDPEMPLAVELHFQFWNERLERLRAPGVEEFWSRRVTRETAGLRLPSLSRPDALGYASLHVLRHILQGSGRPFHVYEVACFLDSHAVDSEFWSAWRELHSAELRRLESVAFRLACEWFGCRPGSVAQEEMERLPAATQAWFEKFATSPAAWPFHPRKDELWLHLSLLDSPRDAWSVARRRLLPGRLPGQVDAIYIPHRDMSWSRRALKQMRYWAFVASRVRHHIAALPGTARSGVRWWWRTNGLGRQFWIFLTAAVLFNFGLFIFVLLYNLYLLDLGFHEDFLGVLGAIDRAGLVVGILPAAFVARRFGLRNALLAVIVAGAGIVALRSLSTARVVLGGLAFLWGLVFSVWAVVLAPTIAGVVEEKRRPAAFSLFFATMFAVGIAGNWMGGHLPLWVHGKQAALLCAAGLVAAAILPAHQLAPARKSPAAGPSDPAARAPERARVYPRGPFLARYLVPFSLWHLATGAFNPFPNAYFQRLKFPVEQIGNVFSGSQVMQVGAVLMAPLVFRKAGLVPGIGWMMAATAVGLCGLAAEPPGAAAVVAYAGYMSFQWMSEPGLNTLLMNHVEERERSGASSLNYLVAFSAQAVAAFAAGRLIAPFGYGAVLAGAAALAALAGGLFQVLVRGVREWH